MMEHKARGPLDGNWLEIPVTWKTLDGTLEQRAFVSPLGIRVISAIELLDGKPELHISMTDNGERIPASIVPVVLKQFGADDWNEDNHAPGGKARNFWKPLTSDKPDVCPCQDNEKPTIEGDYVWREE